MGIGAIPDAVLSRLGNKHDLGVHTEMFSDVLVPLIEGGVVTNRLKNVHPGAPSRASSPARVRLFDFVHDNQLVEFHPCDRTNDTALIRKNPRVVAINSALEIDLTGQVCADSIGHRIYSGIGGQMDFIRGAALSRGGKAIIALPSTAKNGQVSRIVSTLKPGAGVVTTRGHVQYVATEYGVGGPPRAEPEAAGRGPDLDRPPRLPGGTRPRGPGDPSFRSGLSEPRGCGKAAIEIVPRQRGDCV